MKTSTIIVLVSVFSFNVTFAQTTYTGIFKPSDKSIHFIAHAEGDSIILLTNKNNEVHFTTANRQIVLTYGKDEIVIREDSLIKKLMYVKKGLAASDGKLMVYTNAKRWDICITDKVTGKELVKGNYEFLGEQVKIKVWSNDTSFNPELMAIIINSLIDKTNTIQRSNEWLYAFLFTL